jgi:LacI family transcriptional regulator
MATITDVSKKAGVSRSTVSRVVADNGYVSQDKRETILAAIAELGYRPNTMARGLRSNRSDIIGGVVVNVSSPFYAQMVGGTQMACRAAGKSLLVTSGHAEIEAESRAIIELLDRACDGLILYLENPIQPDVLDILRKSGVPVVTIGGDDCAVARASIAIDNFSGAREAMRYLLDLGHRRIAHLSGGLMYRDSRERLRGIEAALGEYGLGLGDIHIEYGAFEERFGFAATETLLESGEPITAIFAGDDDIAAGALLALKRHGRRVPEDVSLIGFDDNFHARHLTPALTTVRQPVGEAGQLAANLLLQLLAGEAPERTEITVPTQLVMRESVARPRLAETVKERA